MMNIYSAIGLGLLINAVVVLAATDYDAPSQHGHIPPFPTLAARESTATPVLEDEDLDAVVPTPVSSPPVTVEGFETVLKGTDVERQITKDLISTFLELHPDSKENREGLRSLATELDSCTSAEAQQEYLKLLVGGLKNQEKPS